MNSRLLLWALILVGLIASDVELGTAQSFQINVWGNVDIFLRDPGGRRTGFDTTSNQYLRGIPDVHLGSASIGILSGDSTIADPSGNHAVDALVPNAIPGEYDIVLRAGSLTEAGVDIMVHHHGEDRTTHYIAGSVLDSGMAVEIRFVFDYNDELQSSIEKTISAAYIDGELVALRKQGSILDDSTLAKYRGLFQSFFADLRRNRIEVAMRLLHQIKSDLASDGANALTRHGVRRIEDEVDQLLRARR